MLVGDWLTELECEVAGSVNSVDAALRIAKAEVLHAALLDVNLGNDNSFALADALLDAGVPVAFITGRDSNSLPERFRLAPILCKPFDFTAIELLMKRLLAVGSEPSP